MHGLAGYARTVHRERTNVWAIAAVIGLFLALSVLAPSSAHASGCSDSWTNTAGGSWFTATNWSKGAPPSSEEEACITAEGTYTVTMTQESGTVSVGSLTVGGTSGTQTLAVGSSCSVNAVLATTAGIVNGAHGAITLTNGDGCGDGVTLTGPISNAGTLTVEPEHGGTRTIQGSLTNTGTLAINANTAYNGASAALANQGAIDLAEGKQLAVSNSGSVANEAGGSIVAIGSGNLSLGSGTSFTEGAGTTGGTEPVIVDDGSLSYTGPGTSLIALRGSSSLSGASVAAQSLSIQSTCSENTTATAATGFTNGGTITLTNGDNCSDNVTVAIPSGTLANSGKIISEPDHGGTRTIEGSVTNTGTLTINANTAYSGASAQLINEGAINIAEGIGLTVSKSGSVGNATGGSITTVGNGNLSMGSGTTFNEGAGTIGGGTKPVIVDDGTLNYGAGGGSSLIALHGADSLSGNLVVGQSLLVESTCGENATVTASANYKNAGTITLTNGDGCGNNATLATSSGTLTNTGKLITELDHGGARTIQGNLINTGILNIKANTAYNAKNASLVNEGTLNIAEARELNVSSNGSVTNGTGGKIVTSGGSLVLLTGGTFTEGAGTTGGTKPVIVDDGTLDYTGEGKSVIALHGTDSLSGNLVAGQSLLAESTCGENATVNIAENVTNGGTITLTNGDGCGNNATIATSTTSTLTNSGQIVSELDHGGARAIQGNLKNTGTLTVNANTSDTMAGANVQNDGAINIAETVTFSVTGSGATTTNGTGGLISGNNSGVFAQTGGTFDEASGAGAGHQPVILDDATLNYTEHGSGPIELRGSSTMSGAVRSGQTLAVASTCGENANVSVTASFINNGTIELTNGDGCGNSATLNMKGGTLTNHEKLTVANPHGGGRTIEGNLTNQSLLRLEAGQTLHVTGNFTQTSIGRIRTLIASASSYGAMSVTGTARLTGTLVLRQLEPFKASLGQTFSIISSAALTGAFASETEDQINATGLYYKPTYSASAATLVVTQATQTPTPNNAAPGSTVVISGSGYVPGDTITPRFTDRKGVQTFYPEVTVNSSGEFSTEITIPEGAATGIGQIHTTSTVTGVHINQTFTVT